MSQYYECIICIVSDPFKYINWSASISISIHPDITQSIHLYQYQFIHMLIDPFVLCIHHPTKYINSSIHRSTHVSMCQSIHVLINQSILYINQLIYIDPFRVSMQWFDIRMNQYYIIIGIVSVSYGWIRGRIHTINSSKYRLINSCYCYPFMYFDQFIYFIQRSIDLCIDPFYVWMQW